MRSVIGPSFACTRCISDKNLPDDDMGEDARNTTILTIWNGNMVCMYHLPTVIEDQLQEAIYRR